MRVFRIVALLSLVMATQEVGAVPEEVVLDLRSSGAVRVPVNVNGQGPFTFLLDTGASHTTVSSEIVDRLSLPAVAKVKVVTAAGVQMRLVVRLEHMAIGSASAAGLMPSVVPPDELHAMESGIDGVIGQDFLSAFNYTLDYRRQRLRWTADDDDGSVRLPLIRAGHRSLVRLTGKGRQAPMMLVPDSGSEGLVLFERKGRTTVKLDETSQLVGVSAVGLQRAGRGALVRELQVGGVTLRNQPAVVVTSQGSSDVEGDGLMPLHQFSSVSFNNAQAYMVVRR
jgi:predicted aspartyl protease